MRALIDWSFDLLTDQEKVLFRRLAVFAGGWTLEAASEICADEMIESWDVLDLLSSLVDKSLVTTELADSHQRYRLLESMRQYARERLASSSEAPAVYRRHATYFAKIAVDRSELWNDISERDFLAPFAPELDNFRAALTWSLAEGHDIETGAWMAGTLFRVYDRLATTEEGLQWCRAASASGATLSPLLQAKLAYAYTFLLHNSGRFIEALEAARSAVDAYRECDDPVGLTHALMQTANLLAINQRYDEARVIGEEAVSSARALGDRQLTARTIQYLAATYAPAEIDQARSLFRECTGIFRSLSREAELANALVWWAEFEAAAGEFERAITLGRESLTISQRMNLMLNHLNIAAYELCLDRPAEAAPLAQRGMRLAIEMQRPVYIAFGAQHLASVVAARGDTALAARLAGWAEARLSALQSQRSPTEQIPFDKLMAHLRSVFDQTELMRLMKEGSVWNEDQGQVEACRV